jgi:hypothetical protein
LEVWSGHIPWFLFVEPHADSCWKRQWAQNSVIKSTVWAWDIPGKAI